MNINNNKLHSLHSCYENIMTSKLSTWIQEPHVLMFLYLLLVFVCLLQESVPFHCIWFPWNHFSLNGCGIQDSHFFILELQHFVLRDEAAFFPTKPTKMNCQTNIRVFEFVLEKKVNMSHELEKNFLLPNLFICTPKSNQQHSHRCKTTNTKTLYLSVSLLMLK